MERTRMNQHDCEVSSTQQNDAYIERVQHRLKLQIRNHSEIHHSPKFTLDPGNFICNASKVVAHLCDHGLYKLAGGWVEVESDGG